MHCLPSGGPYLATFWTSDVDPKLCCGMRVLNGPAEPGAVAAMRNAPQRAPNKVVAECGAHRVDVRMTPAADTPGPVRHEMHVARRTFDGSHAPFADDTDRVFDHCRAPKSAAEAGGEAGNEGPVNKFRRQHD
jgi:hypothetical protein